LVECYNDDSDNEDDDDEDDDFGGDEFTNMLKDQNGNY